MESNNATVSIVIVPPVITKIQMFLCVGIWNQAYQMDTLPIVVMQEELRPGTTLDVLQENWATSYLSVETPKAQ